MSEDLEIPRPSRRHVLTSSGLAMAAPILARLAAAQTVFADQLGNETRLPKADQYALDPDVTYLNHASIGTVPRIVQEAHRRYLEICESNPWLYMWGDAWQEPREEVRRKAARLLKVEADEIALTHNTTEAFNLLAHGLPLGCGDEVLMSSLNHSGASVCWEQSAAVRGFEVKRFDFPVLETPGMSAEDVLNLYDAQIGKKTRVLVFPHVDNTVGLRHPVRELARLARFRGVRFVAVDAAQTAGMLPLDVAALEVDAYATSGHKWLQSPKGLGVAYLRRALHEDLRPMWTTWGQRRWRGTVRIYEDYGTRNLPEVLALGDAIDYQTRLGEATKEAHHRRLFQHAREAVAAAPRLVWRSPERFEMGAALYAVEARGADSRELFERLFAEHGFVFRPFSTQGLNTIRLSPNVANSTAELERLFSLLA